MVPLPSTYPIICQEFPSSLLSMSNLSLLNSLSVSHSNLTCSLLTTFALKYKSSIGNSLNPQPTPNLLNEVKPDLWAYPSDMVLPGWPAAGIVVVVAKQSQSA